MPAMYLIVGCHKHARAWLVAYFAGLRGRIGDLAMGVDVGEGSHEERQDKCFPSEEPPNQFEAESSAR